MGRRGQTRLAPASEGRRILNGLDPTAGKQAGNRRFPKRDRLLSAAEFMVVFSEKRSVADGCTIVYARPNGRGYSRLGLSIGRKFGNAVARNRLRRLCREVFRCHRDQLPQGWDFVIVPQSADMPSADRVRRSLLRLMQRVTRKASRRDSR